MFRSRRSPSDIIGGKNPTVPSSPETCMAFFAFIAQFTLDLELHVMRDTRDFLIRGVEGVGGGGCHSQKTCRTRKWLQFT